MSPQDSSQETSPRPTITDDSQQPAEQLQTSEANMSTWNAAALPRPIAAIIDESEANSTSDQQKGANMSAETPLETLQQLPAHDAQPPPPPPKDVTPVAKKALAKQASPAVKQEEWDEKQESSLDVASGEGEHFLSEDDGERPAGDQKRESRPEIQGIMDQFEGGRDSEPAELKRTLTGGSVGGSLPVFQYPPRLSSLTNAAGEAERTDAKASGPGASHEASSKSSASNSREPDRSSISSNPITVTQPPPPAPDPEPDLPFDFHRFLEQLRHRTADPVAKFLRSFLQEFGKRPWMVHEQQKIISDFLAFIANRMAQCEVWKNVSDAEFDNAREGMEKLVMNRLYTQTFSPEIAPPEPIKTQGRRKPATPAYGAGRRGQHQEDVERDEVLAQKIRIYGWVKEEHLDLPAFSDKGRKFLSLAQQELAKIGSYRAPRDKVICVLNACKVLFGFLRNSSNDTSADSFIPLLIYTVLKAAPEHLVSNLQYIIRFRNPDKLNGEAGYYMSSLMGAVQFIESLDRTSLTISDADFEKEVEKSVSAIAERHEREEKRASADRLRLSADKSGLSRAEVTQRNSEENRAGVDGSGEENAAVAGLLRTIQRPLTSIGRFLTESEEFPRSSTANSSPSRTPQPGALPTRSPAPQRTGVMGAIAGSGARAPSPQPNRAPPGAAAEAQRESQRRHLAEQEAVAKQASAEAAEAHRVQRAEHQTVVE